jgi:beta-glucosidase
MPASFPKDFLWGVATSSYQIEGAAKEDGRGESIWDRFAHTPGKVSGGATGNVACDHYHRYPEDVQLMRSLGVNAYRFSIAWPRVLPDGTGAVNLKGLDFYDRLVDELLEAKIAPMATLYHWDLPQALEDRGGWGSRETAYAFAGYAGTVARRLGDRVNLWITHNEMWCTAFLGYMLGIFAPGKSDPKLALQVAHNVLLSHGLAVPEIRAAAPGVQVGIAPNLTPAYPVSASPEDAAAVHRFDGFFNRWFIDPLAGRGYPQDMVELYGSAVPDILPDDMQIIAAPIDFLGVNYYNPVQIGDDPAAAPLFTRRVDDPSLPRTADREYDPDWLYRLLVRLKDEYTFPALVITENGAAFPDELSDDGHVHDEGRVRFLQVHFEAAERALAAGVPLKGYCVWSLMDNFEWAAGYDLRYGITYVDFETQQRVIKDSGLFYRQWIEKQLAVQEVHQDTGAMDSL